MEERKIQKEQTCNLTLEGRKKLVISGVMDVDTFDEENVVLITTLGALCVKGGDLHINKLNVDTGELLMEGEIDCLEYSDNYGGKGKGSFFSKMFK